jgi:hypothetical protein
MKEKKTLLTGSQYSTLPVQKLCIKHDPQTILFTSEFDSVFLPHVFHSVRKINLWKQRHQLGT